MDGVMAAGRGAAHGTAPHSAAPPDTGPADAGRLVLAFQLAAPAE
jgi:hypothetical protein